MRTVRDETPFEEWLQAQELEGLLTRGERQQLGRAVRAIRGKLRDGAAPLIKAATEGAAKGAAEAIVKGG